MKKQIYAITFWNKNKMLFKDTTEEISANLLKERSYNLVEIKNESGYWPTKIKIELFDEYSLGDK